MDATVTKPIGTLHDVDPLLAPRRSRLLGNRRALIFATAALVLGLVGAVGISRSSGRATHGYDSGPVRTDSDTISSIRVEMGQLFTFGGIVLRNSTDRDAMVEGIRTDPPLGDEMTLVDVKAAGRDRKVGYVGTAAEFPPARIPTEALRPFDGAVVPARPDDPGSRGLEILMGLRVNRPGEFGFRHVIVDYRIGGKRHSVRLNDGFIACAPPQAFPPGCHLDTFFE